VLGLSAVQFFFSVDVFSHPVMLFSHGPTQAAVSGGTGRRKNEKPGATPGFVVWN
jgi:hypothetical protein